MNDGGPAFPTNGFDGCLLSPGMTLRDYFAAKAPAEEVNNIMVLMCWHNESTASRYLEAVSNARGMWADAMLKARELPPEAT